MGPCIEDYAIIGDTQTCALVDRSGAIDWLCFPRFDSDACFAALLGDRQRHGTWTMAPTVEVRARRRRYRADDWILETEVEADHGAARILDFMPIRAEAPDVVRIVEGVRGEVPMCSSVQPRFGYGAVTPWISGGERTVSCVAGHDALRLAASLPLERQDHALRSTFTVHAGERHAFVLTWYPSSQRPPRDVDPERALSETADYWAHWAGRCGYHGRWRDAVVRSLMTLKLLTYAPTGGIVAAATTSLPERLGGVRNWDYRFVWLRDATLSLRALIHAGYRDEAEAWRHWLCRAVAGASDQVQPLYGVAGERRLPEWSADWLPGFGGSAPVRVGNAAVDQRQLDVYGETMNSFHLARGAGLPVEPEVWQVQHELMRFVEAHWQEPDQGLWEMRGDPRHFVYSKAMAWVAADRAVAAIERFGLPGPLDQWRALRKAIHEDVCAQGFHPGVGAFTQSYGSTALDASVLRLPLVGFLPASDPRIASTVAALEQRLVRDGLLWRYDHDEALERLPEGEGAFVACSYWLADNYVLAGQTEKAEALFEQLLTLRNDVGLLAEEYDPVARRQLGNVPQAFSHLALVNTALNLEQAVAPRGAG